MSIRPTLIEEKVPLKTAVIRQRHTYVDVGSFSYGVRTSTDISLGHTAVNTHVRKSKCEANSNPLNEPDFVHSEITEVTESKLLYEKGFSP